MNYSPKKDMFYTFVIWSAPIVIIPFLIFSFSVNILIIFILSFLLSFWLWHSTNYKIEKGVLFIKCWLFRRRINIKNIEKVKKTKNPLASYAMALDRLEITEKNKSKYYISPNNSGTFIAELKKYNSDIIAS